MVYKNFKYPTYNIYTIKTDKFKSCHLEVIFRKKIEQNDLAKYSLLFDFLTWCTKKHPNHRDLMIYFEELYRVSISGTISRVGNAVFNSFNCDFINPSYVPEKDFLEQVIKLLMEIIFKPNIENNEFDLKNFLIVKTRLINEIKALKENPNKTAIKETLDCLDSNSPTRFGLFNSLDFLENFTAENLFEVYQELLNRNTCDIFLVGDLDFEKVVKYINKYFASYIIKSAEISLEVNNSIRKTALLKTKPSKFKQTNILCLYNLLNLTKEEKDITFVLFNYIFGGSSFNSKLFNLLREQNSLCYGVDCFYLKYDLLYMIKVSLAKENVKKALQLIKKAWRNFLKGDFTEKEIAEAKDSLIFSLKSSFNNQNLILNNYVFNIYDNTPSPEEKIKLIKKLTKEDLIKLAKKIKLNTTFVLEEDEL